MESDKKIALSTAIANARENFLLMSELWKVSANETKAKYDAYLEAGFTKDQALSLCCAEIGRRAT